MRSATFSAMLPALVRPALLLPVLMLPALILVAGCSGITAGPGDDFVQITAFYNYAASDRDLALSVVGNPFGLPDDGFRHAVETAVQVQTTRPPTHATLAPGPSARKGYSLAFVFDPVPTLRGDDICQGRYEAGGRAGSHPLRMVGAFCMSGRALTEVSGEASLSGPDDPAFREFMHGAVLAIFRPDIANTGDVGGP